MVMKMEYGYKKEVRLDFSDAVRRAKEELQKEGFGVLTEIDVKATLKEKINVEHDDYVILGACNPEFASKALSIEKEIGLLMPCNVIVYKSNGTIYVTTVLPTERLKDINVKLQPLAKEAEKRLKRVINLVGAAK